MANAKPTGKLEVHVSASGNSVFFPPISEAVRGEFDAARLRSRVSSNIVDRWPEVVPGQIIGIDFDTDERYVRDPLYDDAHVNVRQRVISMGYQIPEMKKVFAGESVSTWVWHLRQLVACGYGRIITGAIPAQELFSDAPKKNFIAEEQEDPNKRLTDVLLALGKAVTHQTQLLEKLATSK